MGFFTEEEIQRRKEVIRELTAQKEELGKQKQELQPVCECFLQLKKMTRFLEESTAELSALKKGSKDYQVKLEGRVNILMQIEHLRARLPGDAVEEKAMIRMTELQNQYWELDARIVEQRRALIADSKSRRKKQNTA